MTRGSLASFFYPTSNYGGAHLLLSLLSGSSIGANSCCVAMQRCGFFVGTQCSAHWMRIVCRCFQFMWIVCRCVVALAVAVASSFGRCLLLNCGGSECVWTCWAAIVAAIVWQLLLPTVHVECNSNATSIVTSNAAGTCISLVYTLYSKILNRFVAVILLMLWAKGFVYSLLCTHVSTTNTESNQQACRSLSLRSLNPRQCFQPLGLTRPWHTAGH